MAKATTPLGRRWVQPLQVTITELVVVVVALAMLAVWLPTYQNTRTAVGQLTDRLTASAAREIVGQTRAYVSPARPALELCRSQLGAHSRFGVDPPLPATAPGVWQARAKLCLDVMNANPDLDMAYYGDAQGAWTGTERIDGQIEIDHRWIEGTRHFRRVLRVDKSGAWIPAPDRERNPSKTIRTYDPRKRPWYLAAQRQGRIVWTEPYVFASPGSPLGITAALPLRRGNGPNAPIAGVFAVDFKLFELNHALARMRENGPEVFILSPGRRAGTFRIVAEPFSEADTQKAPAAVLTELRHATASTNPLLRTAAVQMDEQGVPSEGKAMRVHAADTDYLATLYPCSIGQDLKWTLLVAVREKEILGAIEAGTFWSSLLGLGIGLMGAVAGALLSAAVARPLRRFAVELARVGDLDISDEAPPHSSIREVQEMGRVLDRMKAGLRAFQKFVPADVVRLHLKGGHEAVLGGETARITVMFADIMGFTTLAEQMTPAQLVAALADYLEAMERVVSRHEGLVDEYVGDCVVAFWGTPLRPHLTPEQAACAAALELLDEFDRLNCSRPDLHRFDLRVGIHTGEALVGNIGSQRRMGYTAMGDTVNLASRLEGLTRQYEVSILVSEATQVSVPAAFTTRFVDEVAVRGRSAPVRIYEFDTLTQFRREFVRVAGWL